MDEIKDLQKGITDILVAIGKIETEIKQLNNMSNKLDATEKLAIEAMQSTRSAHKRLDEMIEEVDGLAKKTEEIRREVEKRLDDDKKQGKDDKKWLIGVILSILALIWNVIKVGSK